MARKKMTNRTECQKPDYALLLDNLYIALYKKDNNPYILKGNIFGYQTKLAGKALQKLLNEERVNNIPFMPYKEYQSILNGYAVNSYNSIFSGSQERFFLSHLGGWRSAQNTLSDLKNSLFHDNKRSAGTVRSEFASALSTWMCKPDGNGYAFFKKGEPLSETDSEKTAYISEYIVACNYQLVSGYCLDKDGLRQILGDFTDHILEAEENREKSGEKNLVKKNREALDCLIEKLIAILNAYDHSEDQIERDWFLSRALAGLIIGAMLRETLSPQLVKYYIFHHLPNAGAAGISSPSSRSQSIPKMFWEAGKHWYEDVRKPGARFHSLNIVNHILPSAENAPSESEYSFPFRAMDTNDITIQCSRFSELLLDQDSIYHKGHFMLIGEGGIGKTTTLMSAMQDVYDGKEKYSGESVIPLFIELSLSPDSQDSHAYDGISSTVIHRLIYAMLQQVESKKDRSDLFRECMNVPSNIAKEFVRELLDCTAEEEIRYVLLVDGLNEVSAEPFTGRSSSAQGRILQEIKEIIERYTNITVILTGRQSAFIDHPSFHSFYLRGLVWDEIADYLHENGKNDKEIESIKSTENGLLEILSIPMFLTMYVILHDSEGITTRGELMKVFFHERFEYRKKGLAIHRQWDISERIDRDEEQSVSGKMTRASIPLPMQWLFLDVLLPEIAVNMVAAESFSISEDKVCSILQTLFTSPDSLFCSRFIKYANRCFKRRLNGSGIKRIISDFINGYDQDEISYGSAFLKYCESSLGILYKEGEEIFGFIHQHIRDYFAAVSHVNRMKIAFAAFQENDGDSARIIMRQYDKEPLNPIIMVYIGEYLGVHHNSPRLSKDAKVSSVPSTAIRFREEGQLITSLFEIYRNIDQENEFGVYNLIEILKRVRKDLSGIDFHNLDLHRCSFNNVPLDSGLETIFKGAVINAENLLAEGHTNHLSNAVFNMDGSLVVTSSLDTTARLWNTRTGTLVHVLEGHSDALEDANFSPDGRRLLTASFDGTARIWDCQTGTLLHTLAGHSEAVRGANFSMDGQLVVTASMDGTARIWNSHSGAHLLTLVGHSDQVTSASFNRDGSLVITASWDNTVGIWDSKTGTLRHSLRGHTDLIDAAFSRDGRFAITSCLDDTIRIWDSQTGRLIHTLTGSRAILSSDGTLITTVSENGTVNTWNSQTFTLLISFTDHANKVRTARLSEDGCRVIIVSDNGTARIWDCRSGHLLHSLNDHTGRIEIANFSPDGKFFITCSMDGSARIWDCRSGALLQILPGSFASVLSAVFNRDRTKVITASADGFARIWNCQTGTLQYTLEGHSWWIETAVFSEDGCRVLTASRDKTVRIWDAQTGILLHTLPGTSGVFSQDSNLVLTSKTGDAQIWNSQSGILLHTLEGPPSDYVLSSCFSHDGNYVITAYYEGTARIWDTYSGALLNVLNGHSHPVDSASFSPDGRLVVTASRDNTARIWDTQTGNLLYTLIGHSDAVNLAVFSKDGSRVVTASRDNTARIWDAKTGCLLHILEGHTKSVNTAVFSKNGSQVVTASRDSTVRIWNAQTGNLNQTLKGHLDNVNCAYYSNDEKLLITASWDNTARIWDMETMREIETLYEVPGLYINGVNFKDISPRSKIPNKFQKIVQQYGAII